MADASLRWVFGYGSLIWRPGLRLSAVRARAAQRRAPPALHLLPPPSRHARAAGARVRARPRRLLPGHGVRGRARSLGRGARLSRRARARPRRLSRSARGRCGLRRARRCRRSPSWSMSGTSSTPESSTSPSRRGWCGAGSGNRARTPSTCWRRRAHLKALGIRDRYLDELVRVLEGTDVPVVESV